MNYQTTNTDTHRHTQTHKRVLVRTFPCELAKLILGKKILFCISHVYLEFCQHIDLNICKPMSSTPAYIYIYIYIHIYVCVCVCVWATEKPEGFEKVIICSFPIFIILKSSFADIRISLGEENGYV